MITYVDLATVRIDSCLRLEDVDTLIRVYDTITRRELRGLVSVMFIELIELIIYIVKAIAKN